MAPNGPDMSVQATHHAHPLPDQPKQIGGLVPLQTLHDVLAGPARDRDTPGVLWPDFEAQVHARLWRNGRRFCTAPTIDPAAAQIIEAPGVFVSMYDNHFGHMIAETVSRLPQSLAEAPGLPLWFSHSAPMTLARTSGMFRAVLDWLDVPPDLVRFVHQPTLFRTLHIAAQAEYLNGPPPPPAYLDMLEARVHPKLGTGRPTGITYVTRAAMPSEKGTHAAERYLVALLKELGVQVVYPEKRPLKDQMAVYAASKHLIFAEGSAAHGRQLIGRVDQHISILRRRFRSHMAKNQLTPRCTSLTYVPCYGGALYVRDAGGRKIHHAMQSLYNPAPMLAHFEALGLPIQRLWDWPTYLRLRDHDVLRWVAAIYDPKVAPWLRPHNPDAELLDQFEPLGLGHLRGAAAATVRAMRAEAG